MDFLTSGLFMVWFTTKQTFRNYECICSQYLTHFPYFNWFDVVQVIM